MPNMTLVQTLFGGMLLIGALYTLLRFAGLSAYWRGVIAGLLPLLAYTAYFTATQPGGDVLSVHVAVYIATAAVLTLMDSRQKKAEGKARHWGPYVIVGFFGVVVVLQAVFLVVATQGLPVPLAQRLLPDSGTKTVHTGFAGVVHHEPDAAKTVSSYLKQEHKERRLGWKVQLKGLENARVGLPVEIQAEALDSAGNPLDSAQVTMVLKRVAVSGDSNEYAFIPMRDGQFRLQLVIAHPGMWEARLVVRHGEDRYELQRVLEVGQGAGQTG